MLIRAELKYGLVGLHTCGDLGPTILHLFHQVEDASAQLTLQLQKFKLQCFLSVVGQRCWGCCECWLLLYATEGTLSHVQVIS